MKVEINISKTHAYLIIATIFLMGSIITVSSFGGSSPSIVGHSPGEIQGLTTGCPAGQSIRNISENGVVTCEVDTDTNSDYCSGGSCGSLTVSSGLTISTGDLAVSNGAVGFATLASTVSPVDICRCASSQICACTSSIKDKKDVEDLLLGLDEIMRMQPVSFTWKNSTTRDLGFIAEQIYEIDPLLTFDIDDELAGVRYRQLTAVLVNAIKDQQAQIEDLKQRVLVLESE